MGAKMAGNIFATCTMFGAGRKNENCIGQKLEIMLSLCTAWDPAQNRALTV